MKKLLILVLIFFSLCNFSYAAVVTSAYVTADDVTVTQLEQNRVIITNALNSFDGALIQNGTVTSSELDANANPENRWNEAFTDFVYTGLTIPTSASLSSTTTSGTAYVNGVRVVKDATAKTYTASKHTYIDLSSTGTYTYSEVAINAAEPSVASNSIRLARVSTDSTTVLSVRDDRDTSIDIAGGRFEVGSFTRDLSLTTTQEVTGVGFRPSAIIFFGGISSDRVFGIGVYDGTDGKAIHADDFATTDTWAIITTVAFRLPTSAGNEASISSATFDSDGFTLTWTKVASPTGTATINYMAYR